MTHQVSPLRGKDEIFAEGNVKLVNHIKLDVEVLCLRFNNTGKLLAIGLTDGTVKVYCVESKGFSYVMKRENSTQTPVTSVKWKPPSVDQAYDYVLLAAYANGELRTWHVTSGTCINVYKEDSQLLVTAYNASGSHSIAGSDDGNIYLYDEVAGLKLATFGPSQNKEVMDGHVMRVFALQYNPLEDFVFVSGGWDRTVHWWDTRASQQYSVKKISGPQVCGEGIDIEKNSQKLVIASWRKERNLEVYDFGSGKKIKDIPAYSKSMLYCTQWKDRNSLVVGGSNGHTFSAVDYTSGLTTGSVLNLPGGVCALDSARLGPLSHTAAAANKSILIISDDSQ